MPQKGLQCRADVRAPHKAPGPLQVGQVYFWPGHGVLVQPDGLQEGVVEHAPGAALLAKVVRAAHLHSVFSVVSAQSKHCASVLFHSHGLPCFTRKRRHGHSTDQRPHKLLSSVFMGGSCHDGQKARCGEEACLGADALPPRARAVVAQPVIPVRGRPAPPETRSSSRPTASGLLCCPARHEPIVWCMHGLYMGKIACSGCCCACSVHDKGARHSGCRGRRPGGQRALDLLPQLPAQHPAQPWEEVRAVQPPRVSHKLRLRKGHSQQSPWSTTPLCSKASLANFQCTLLWRSPRDHRLVLAVQRAGVCAYLTLQNLPSRTCLIWQSNIKEPPFIRTCPWSFQEEMHMRLASASSRGASVSK